MKGVVSTADLAEELDVTTETVARWIRGGLFRGAFRRRGRWRIPTNEAEAFVEEYRGGEQPLEGDGEQSISED